ncbi:MAG: hypothetical protein KDD56_10145 [Bdellovibrionales bacterium]|nr:hypothetical protein [Bdellovibrionales bacterium]
MTASNPIQTPKPSNVSASVIELTPLELKDVRRFFCDLKGFKGDLGQKLLLEFINTAIESQQSLNSTGLEVSKLEASNVVNERVLNKLQEVGACRVDGENLYLQPDLLKKIGLVFKNKLRGYDSLIEEVETAKAPVNNTQTISPGCEVSLFDYCPVRHTRARSLLLVFVNEALKAGTKIEGQIVECSAGLAKSIQKSPRAEEFFSVEFIKDPDSQVKEQKAARSGKVKLEDKAVISLKPAMVEYLASKLASRSPYLANLF